MCISRAKIYTAVADVPQQILQLLVKLKMR